jgi:cephalosporin hydroxylase
MFDDLVIQNGRLVINGIEFRLENTRPEEATTGATLLLHKTEPQIEIYRDFWNSRPLFHPERVFELGIWQGGSVAFWFECFRPRKHVAVDITSMEESPALQHYKNLRGLHDQIATYWGIDQADAEALRSIAHHEFDAPLDLVIDDVSHLYASTKASFEMLFPLLRPGGLYLIEDWPWAYSPLYRTPDHPWATEEPLTNLIAPLLELAGTSTSVVRSLLVNVAFIAVERGGMSASDLGAFDLPGGRVISQPR